MAYNTFGVSSTYHSFQTKLEQRFSAGLSYLVSYTWSKSLDNGSGLFREFPAIMLGCGLT